jgi:protein arginine kinase activator
MECQICKENAANVHLTRIVGGEVQKATLCEGCAKTHGLEDPLSYSLLEPLLNISAERRNTVPRTRHERRCPSCGMPESKFRSAGRLGCSECYRLFADDLAQLLKAMHKGSQHTGKRPSRFADNVDSTDSQTNWSPLQTPPTVPPVASEKPLFQETPAPGSELIPDQSLPLYPAAAGMDPTPSADPLPTPAIPAPPLPQGLKLIAKQGSDTFTTNTSPKAKGPSLAELQKRLELAIQEERFEDAALLRDKLNALGEQK